MPQNPRVVLVPGSDAILWTVSAESTAAAGEALPGQLVIKLCTQHYSPRSLVVLPRAESVTTVHVGTRCKRQSVMLYIRCAKPRVSKTLPARHSQQSQRNVASSCGVQICVRLDLCRTRLRDYVNNCPARTLLSRSLMHASLLVLVAGCTGLPLWDSSEHSAVWPERQGS